MRLSDEEYVFRQDIREKKSAGRGIYAKKNGSKSRKCTLPSDNLTKRQREKMNGEAMTYDLKKFYSWEAFKSLPVHIQVEYLNCLVDTYHVALTNIAKEQFGLCKTSLRSHAMRYQYYKKLHIQKHGFQPKKADLDCYITDLLLAMDGQKTSSTQGPVESKESVTEDNSVKEQNTESTNTVLEEETNEQMYASVVNLSQVNLTMDGFDFDILHYLANRYGDKQKIRVSISVDMIE